jgi:uroporphyrinogen III methyltransferase / synthase
VTVYLVGAGPGDPGLLTVRGAAVLRRADVVVYDRLSVSSLLELAPPEAERISVGKAPGRATMGQDQIDELLVERGRAGLEVVRLKGGDPFVFARGGEEAAALLRAGVDFEVVPGVSSAIAAPAYAGIPLTLRHSSTLFTVITGHEDPDKPGEIDWEAVAGLGGTIVVLMGVGRWPAIAARLLAGGLPPDTPAAAVRWGTRPQQHTVRATLSTLADHDLESPSTIVVGAVAGLNLAWFESRPLFGRRVVVTRSRQQASELSDALAAAGAEPVEVPVIEVVDPTDGGAALRAALAEVSSYDWVVVSSANGAARLLGALRDARDLAGVQVAAVGSATAAVLAGGGIVADLVPDRYVGEGLVESFPPAPRPPSSSTPRRVLLVRAEVARDVVPDGLAAKGWSVQVAPAYRTVPAAVSDAGRQAVAGADAVTFTSSSTAEQFVAAVGLDAVPPVVATIGPVTSATVRGLGLDVAVEAVEHTTAGLVDALVAHLGSASSTPAPDPRVAG